MSIEQYQEIKRKVDQLQRTVDRSAGAIEQITSRLEKEFGCKDIESARKLLKKLEKESSNLQANYEQEQETFQTKWRDKL